MSNPLVELVGLPGFRVEQRMGTDFSVTDLFATDGLPAPRRVMSVYVGILGFPSRNPDTSPSPATYVKGLIIDQPVEWRCVQNRQSDAGRVMCETTVPWSPRSSSPELGTVLRVTVTGDSETELTRYRRLAETQIRFVRQVPGNYP
jgi:hypothetical protein